MPEATCLKVQRDLAEKAIIATSCLGIFNRDLKVQQVLEQVLIPLNALPSPKDLEELKKNVGEFEVSTSNFVSREKHPRSLIDVLEDELPPHLVASLPKSLDIIGEVAVVELPPELEGRKKLLGRAILSVYKNVRVVLAKAGAIGGPYRVRAFEVIAGKGGTETTHQEHGCAYRLDVAKVYFSPRLAYEHSRVSSQVKENEVVLDMFAGVGPFSILIAKKHRRIKVYSIDINPVAIQYLKQNMSLNKVQNRVIPLQGDARKLVEEQLAGMIDRVIMNLPAEALAYVDVACKALKPEGGIIHYYEIAAEPDPLEKAKAKFSEAVLKAGRKVERFIAERMVKPTAPHEWQVAIDAIIR